MCRKNWPFFLGVLSALHADRAARWAPVDLSHFSLPLLIGQNGEAAQTVNGVAYTKNRREQVF